MVPDNKHNHAVTGHHQAIGATPELLLAFHLLSAAPGGKTLYNGLKPDR